MDIPNAPTKSAALSNIAGPDDGDWGIATLAHLDEGVREVRTLAVPAQDAGCAVSAGGGMTVDVAAGVIIPAGLAIPVAAVTGLAVAAADLGNPRLDLVVVSSAGVISVITGTVTINPDFPVRAAQGGPVPDDSVILASLYITPGLTVILDTPVTDSHITDKRVFLREPLSTPNVQWPTGKVIYGLPGWNIAGFSSHPTVEGVIAVPIYVAHKTTYDRMAMYVVTGGSAQVGLGVYTSVDDGEGMRPDRLIVDAGGLPVPLNNNTFYIVTLSPSLILMPGFYYTAMAGDTPIAAIRSPNANSVHVEPVMGEGLAVDITSNLGLERTITASIAPAAPALPDPFGQVAATPFLATSNIGYGFFLGRTTA